MAIRRSGWNPKEYVTNASKRAYSNPSKIESAENRLRSWQNSFVDDGAMRLNDRENGEGNARIRQPSRTQQLNTRMQRVTTKKTAPRRKK